MNTLTNSKRYTDFIHDRDKALETILQHAQTDISRYLHDLLERFLDMVARHQLTSQTIFRHGEDLLDARMTAELNQTANHITARIMRMRKAVHVLAASGHAEAIAQATGKETSFGITRQDLDQVAASKTWRDENWNLRVHLALSRLKRKILDAVELSRVLEETPAETLERVKKALPEIKTYKRPPRELAPLREAEYKLGDKMFLDTGIIDDDAWQDMVDQFKDTELPATRFDNEAELVGGAPEGYNVYSWEIEQELNQDFVDQVRKGEHKAAKELGVKEFIWIAVIDDRTDECCLKRDGKTLTRIEEELKSGKLDKNTCDATTPPAHMNCRCQIAPVGEVTDAPQVEWGTFDDWIKQ